MVGGATEEAVGKREGTQKKGDTTKSIGKCVGVLEMACKCIIHKRKEKKRRAPFLFLTSSCFFLAPLAGACSTKCAGTDGPLLKLP